ncbi:unnamed protein product [Rhizoctonia solani]|uniref:Protein kinase domain-containing protein n=1 Tax=Rhizoctonia solani TaxID=456999 RepID=A0A8H3E0Q4_9AGAM|nr:unnamed protein product [Rhizoctonia solani]
MFAVNKQLAEGHTRSVQSVAFSPDGKSVISASNDRTVRMWHARSSSPIGEPLIGHDHYVYSVSYSPLGNLIASGSNDKTIRLWDTNTGHQSGKTLNGECWVSSVAFSSDAKLIVSGCGADGFSSKENDVQLWNVQTRTPASGPFKGHTNSVNSVSFSPDSARLVSGSFDKTIRVWNVERGTTIAGPLEGHTGWVHSTRFSPDGAQIASCSDDRTIRFWDPRTGGMIGGPYRGHAGAVLSVSYSPCGTYVTSGGGDKTVRLWDIRTGRQVYQPFREHTNYVNSVTFSLCGHYIASGSADCKVIIRKTSSEDPNSDEHPNSDEDPDPQIITSQMSAREIFQCLVETGCNDLSSMMDPSQDAARIVSGGGFGDIWMGYLNLLFDQRAARELHYWSQMEHKNIHRLMGVILFKDEYLGMVSEWMENGDLHKYLRYHPTTDRYQLDIALGLEYMHNRRTVHGDIKAANILVSPDGVAKISDFDFSVMSEATDLAFTASSNTRSGSIRWVAPEMLDGEIPKRTTQSDVYALGMTMLEVFTGRVPYPDRRMDTAVLIAVMQGTLPTRPFQYLRDDEQGNFVWKLLLDCWSRSPNERPSAGQVAKVLESCTGNT